MKIVGYCLLDAKQLEKVARRCRVSIEKYISVVSTYFFGRRVSTHSLKKTGRKYEITFFG